MNTRDYCGSIVYELTEKFQAIRDDLRRYIDGRPRFAKHSINDGEKVKIAAIDPDFARGLFRLGP